MQFGFLVESTTGKSLLEPGDLVMTIDNHQCTSIDQVLAATDSNFNFNRKIDGEVQNKAMRTTSEGVRGYFVAMVAAVKKGGPAESAGLEEGDVITRINGHHFKSIEEFMTAVANNDEVTVVKSPLTDVHQQKEVSIKTVVE